MISLLMRIFFGIAEAREGFLIHQAEKNKCISIENEMITAKSCNPLTDNQRWRWTQYNQLQNILNQTCLSVRETPVNWVRLKLSTCNRHDKYQVWVCVNDLVRLNGTILNVNYGNAKGRDNVVLYQETFQLSKWKVYGENVRVCEKRPQGILTISRDVMCCTLASFRGASFDSVVVRACAHAFNFCVPGLGLALLNVFDSVIVLS